MVHRTFGGTGDTKFKNRSNINERSVTGILYTYAIAN